MSITSSGFAALPTTPPGNWPASINWPSGGAINGTKTYTISDVDAQQMLAWIATTYSTQLVGANNPPVTVPAVQIFVAWLNGFMQATTDSTQRHHTTPPAVPPPISIA